MGSTNDCGTRDEREYIRELESRVKSLNAFIDSSGAGMYVSDFYTCEVLYANRKMIALGGHDYDPSQLFGRTCWSLVNPKGTGRCPFCKHDKLIDANGEPLAPYTWEQFFPSPQGGIWLRVISQAIVWTDGRLAQMNTFYDISETKRMQEELAAHAREKEYQRSQQELQAILDTMPIAVRILNHDDGTLAYTNKAALELFNCESADDLISNNGFSSMPELQPDGRNTAGFLEELNALDSFQEVFRCFKLTGEPLDLRITSCTISYKGKRASLAVLEDITAQQETQRRLLNAAEKEREANQLKSTFLSNMSHEIRTPMNAIVGLTEIELRRKHSRESLDVYKKINISARSLLQIVNDILDMSKIEADKMELYPDEFELEDVINSAMLVVTPRLEGKRVELLTDISLSLPRFMVGDKTRLWQIIRNALDNAAKFTEKGHIFFSVTEDVYGSDTDAISVCFTITDTGVGMDKEQLRRALLPYEQIYGSARARYEGTGLGLPLSKRLCELMGGTVEIESAPQWGTTIRFTIPFSRSKNCPADSTPLRPALQGPSNLKILAIDDSKLTLNVIAALLEGTGAALLTARDGKQALMLVEKFPELDVILLDYIIEDENGLNLAEGFRKIVPDTTRIILVTAYGRGIDRAGLKALGIDDIIEKPFVPTVFYEKVLLASGRKDENPENEADEDLCTGFKDVRVLVCEDNKVNQLVAEGMLEQFGISPVFAENGKIGLDILNENGSFDLIFMDIHMPVMDGYEAARAIRADDRFKDIPLVSLTADAMSEALLKCLASGMNDYLSKPFIMDDFYKMLLKWLPADKRVYGSLE